MIKKDELTLLWDSPIHTDRNIQANKPDILVKDEKKRECTLVDKSVPSDKYRDLQIEISRCWNMNTKVVPIDVGALGTVGKNLSLKLSTLLDHLKFMKSREQRL